jgi:hypothetical protein
MMAGVLTARCSFCEWSSRQRVAAGDELVDGQFVQQALLDHITREHPDQIGTDTISLLPTPPVFLLRLTPSQRMALLDVISMVMVPPLVMQGFVDVVRQVETTPGELLALVMDAEIER